MQMICLDCGFDFTENMATEDYDNFGDGILERFLRCPACFSREISDAEWCPVCLSYYPKELAELADVNGEETWVCPSCCETLAKEDNHELDTDQ